MAATNQSAMDSAVRHLVTRYNPAGNRVGWLMMASILVEAWDLYSIAFVLVFIGRARQAVSPIHDRSRIVTELIASQPRGAGHAPAGIAP
jgi:hypothetical protein